MSSSCIILQITYIILNTSKLFDMIPGYVRSDDLEIFI